MRRKRLFLLFFLFLFCSIHTLVEATGLYYILDGSGSMWGRVDGEMKIVAAKKVMTQLIVEMPPEIDSGLTVYGHRRKGDCSDIAELIPLGRLDREQATRAVQSIKPKGKTPIAESIQQVAARLKGQEDETTIVLVSDGIETCGGNPCKVTRELREAGIKFVMHTIGFNVGQQASDQLACVAMEGGGHYFSVTNAAELLETLSTVQKSVVTKTPAPIPEPPPEVKEIKQQVSSSSTSLRIKINRPGRVSFTTPSWLKKPYYWELVDPETGENRGKFNSIDTTVVPAGEYQIAWRQHEHGSSSVVLAEVVTVKSGEESIVPLTTSMQLNVPSWVKKPYYWKLLDPETGEQVFQSNRLEPCLVPAGEYTLIWRQSQHYAEDAILSPVNIEPDTLNIIEVATAFNPVPADWMQKKISYWDLREISPDGKGKMVARFGELFTPQLVPAGRYHLVYRLSEHGSTDSFLGEVEITAGKMNEFAMNTGAAFVLPEGIDPPYFVEFIPLDGAGKEGEAVRLNGSYLKGNFGPIALAPGAYKINYRQQEHGSSTITLVDSFDLQAGNLVEIEL